MYKRQDKIRAVDASIAEEMGFDSEAVIPVSGQTYNIDCINRVLLCGPLRLTQFAAYIAGEVFISSHIMVNYYKEEKTLYSICPPDPTADNASEIVVEQIIEYLKK